MKAMRFQKLYPFASLLVLSGAAAGCHHEAQAAGNTAVVPTNPAPFATPPLLAGTPDIATLVARVKPAVVNITTTHEVKTQRGGFDPFGFFDHGSSGQMPFGGRGMPRGGDGGETHKQQALGSGFIIDPQGHVVSNAHVIDGADTVRVRLADDREFDAKVIGRDTRLDLAVLELQGATNLPFVSLGSSDALRVGEYAVAIGNPVRPRRYRDDGHRKREEPLDRRGPVRRFHPDGCIDQPRQQWRPALQPPGSSA